MFKIENGRLSFYQWDTNQRLIIEDATITEVHFCNKTSDCALVCGVYEEDNKRLVNVPNILLQEDWVIYVFAYSGNHTRHEESFIVYSRTKPDSYIYNETEVKSFELLEKRIEALEKNGGGSGSGGEVDLTGYATEEFVNDAIANIDIPEVEGVVKYSEPQELTDAERLQVNDNISIYKWVALTDKSGTITIAINPDKPIDMDIVKTVKNTTGNGEVDALTDLVRKFFRQQKSNIANIFDTSITTLNYVVSNYEALKSAGAFTSFDIWYENTNEKRKLGTRLQIFYGKGLYQFNFIKDNGMRTETIYYNPTTQTIESNSNISAYNLDKYLMYEGMYAEGKAVGDRLTELENSIPVVEGLATEEYVNDAIGEAHKENVFELIERVETTEEISIFTRDKEPNGTPYDFKRVCMFMITQRGAEKKAGVMRTNGILTGYLDSAILNSSDVPRLSAQVSEVRNGALRVDTRNHYYGSSYQTPFGGMYNEGYITFGETNIRSVAAAIVSGTIPIGTVFEIWGVRS